MGKNLGMGAFKPRYLCSENGRGLSIWIWLYRFTLHIQYRRCCPPASCRGQGQEAQGLIFIFGIERRQGHVMSPDASRAQYQ